MNSGQRKRCNFLDKPEKSSFFLSWDIRIGGIRGGEKIGVNVGRTSEVGEEAAFGRVVCHRAIVDRYLSKQQRGFLLPCLSVFFSF